MPKKVMDPGVVGGEWEAVVRQHLQATITERLQQYAHQQLQLLHLEFGEVVSTISVGIPMVRMVMMVLVVVMV